MAKKTDNDANDDGLVSEAEEAAAGPIDGDGDGKIDEDEADSPETAKARERVRKELKRQSKRSAAADKRLAKAEEERRAAGKDVDRATDEVGAAHKKRDALPEGTPEWEAAHADFKDRQKALSDSMNEYDDADKYSRYMKRERRERAAPLQDALGDLGESVNRESVEAEEAVDALQEQLDADPENEALRTDLAKAERRLKKKSAKAQRTSELVDEATREIKSDSGDEETERAEKAANALQVGPRGGRYYVAPSGEKVYAAD